jgi:phosphonate transport system substrate-binding protein
VKRVVAFVVVVAVAVVAVVALAGCPAQSDGGLSAFEGGFDPTRYDAGPQAPANDLGRPLRFAVPPFYSDKIAEGAAGTLERYLEDETRLPVEIRSPKAYDYSALINELESGEIDLAELSPYQFALIDEKHTVVAVAATVAHGASSYGSYLVVRQGSPLRSVSDLKGKTIAFVDPLSTSGYLLPALFLRDHGIAIGGDEGVRAVFVGSHPAAVEAVKQGTVDVAAVSSDLLIGNAGLAGPLVVIAKAGRMPYDVIVARRDLDKKTFAQVQRALFTLSIHDERGRAALRAFSSVDGFMPVPPGHYDGVKALAKKAATLTPPTTP